MFLASSTRTIKMAAKGFLYCKVLRLWKTVIYSISDFVSGTRTAIQS